MVDEAESDFSFLSFPFLFFFSPLPSCSFLVKSEWVGDGDGNGEEWI